MKHLLRSLFVALVPLLLLPLGCNEAGIARAPSPGLLPATRQAPGSPDYVKTVFDYVSRYYYTEEFSAPVIVDSAAERAVEHLGPDRLARSGSLGNIVLRAESGRELRLQVAEGESCPQIAARVSSLISFLWQEFPAEDRETLSGKILSGAISGLDPHSDYLSRQDYRELQTSTQGNFSGVGMELSVKDKQLTVVAPLDNSPAQRAGILPGDAILAIDGTPTQGLRLAESVQRIRGPVGSPVTLTVLHQGDSRPVSLQIIRDTISIVSVKVEEIAPGYLHVRISTFHKETPEELHAALARHAAASANGIILDLRNNPGGLLDSCLKVADAFLPKGLFIRLKGRTAASDQNFSTTTSGDDSVAPLVILVNPGSASSSEVLTLGLQDRQRALVMGQTTFGKGTVQSIFSLPDGTALKLTIAQFLSPSQRAIQKVGIVPDVVLRVRGQEKDALRETQLPNAIGTGAVQAKGGQPVLGVERAENRDGELLAALEVLKRTSSRSVNKLLQSAVAMSREPAFAVAPEQPAPAPTPALADSAPPTITLLEPASARGLKVAAREEQLPVKASITDPSGITWVLVNGQPATLRGDLLSTSVPLKSGENTVIINAADGNGNIARLSFTVAREGAAPQVAAQPAAPAVKPTLWVMSVGVSRYGDSRLNLRFAADDARSLARTLQNLGARLYSEVKVRVLTDQEATRENIINAMSGFLGQAGKDDIAFIFMAGHGVLYSPTGSYYFMTHDASADTMISRALKWSDFQEMVKILSNNTNKIVLALDTCHAGAMEVGARAAGGGEDLAATMREASGVYTLGASKPGEQSLEDTRYALDSTAGHGVFTYSLIKGLRGEANANQDAYVSLMEVFSYVSREVPRLSGGRQHPYAKITGTDLPLAQSPN